MHILFYHPDTRLQQQWIDALQAALPSATIRLWQANDTAPADYAAVWKPVPGMLGNRTGLKAVFNLGAGVDGLLTLPDLPRDIPVIRIDDAGMAVQMAEYVTYAVLQHFRDFDRYAAQARNAHWEKLPPRNKSACRIGILGMGVLGTRIAHSLIHFDFPVCGWRRNNAATSPITTYHGKDGLSTLLAQSDVLVCALPLTPETHGILDHNAMAQLPQGAYIINIARGEHVVEQDLLYMLDQQHVSGATLDAFTEEPLPTSHPYWHHPHIHVTPHISAMTVIDASALQVAQKITALQSGLAVNGIVDLVRGY